jgi:hypothetical protein
MDKLIFNRYYILCKNSSNNIGVYVGKYIFYYELEIYFTRLKYYVFENENEKIKVLDDETKIFFIEVGEIKYFQNCFYTLFFGDNKNKNIVKINDLSNKELRLLNIEYPEI